MTVENYVFSDSYPKNTSNIILYNYCHLQTSTANFWLNFKATDISTGRKEERLKLLDSIFFYSPLESVNKIWNLPVSLPCVFCDCSFSPITFPHKNLT